MESGRRKAQDEKDGSRRIDGRGGEMDEDVGRWGGGRREIDGGGRLQNQGMEDRLRRRLADGGGSLDEKC